MSDRADVTAVHEAVEIGPMAVLDVATGFMASKYLFVASELRVFEALAGGPQRLEDVAHAVQVAAPRLQLLFDALLVLGLVERHGGRFRNSAVAAAFLAGADGPDLRPLLRFWNDLNYPLWTKLKSAIRSGQGFGSFRLNPGEQRIYSEGVAACSGIDAAALPDVCDFRCHRAVLDLGGGTGTWLKPLLERCPLLRGTLFELPGAAAIARERLGGGTTAPRVSIVEGDFFHDPIPPGHDAVLLANVIHGLSPDDSQRLLRRIRAQADSATRLLLVDSWVGAPTSSPRLAALMAGGFLVSTGDGMVYSVDEVREWLQATGWSFVEYRGLPYTSGVVVADAI